MWARQLQGDFGAWQCLPRWCLRCRSLSALKEAYGADAVTEAGLAILEQQFPAYSPTALKAMLEAAGGDVASALDSMSSLEAQHSKGHTPATPGKPQVCLSCLH